MIPRLQSRDSKSTVGCRVLMQCQHINISQASAETHNTICIHHSVVMENGREIWTSIPSPARLTSNRMQR